MLCVFAGCALCLTPLARPASALVLDPLGWSLLVFCGVNSAVSYGALAASLEHLEASRVGAVLALVPLATLASVSLASGIWPAAVHSEHIAAGMLVGAVLVVCGSLLTALGGDG